MQFSLLSMCGSSVVQQVRTSRKSGWSLAAHVLYSSVRLCSLFRHPFPRVDWSVAELHHNPANAVRTSCKSKHCHSSSGPSELCVMRVQTKIMEGATPRHPKEPQKTRRPGPDIPLIDHAIQGEDSYKHIRWPLCGFSTTFATLFGVGDNGRGEKFGRCASGQGKGVRDGPPQQPLAGQWRRLGNLSSWK